MDSLFFFQNSFQERGEKGVLTPTVYQKKQNFLRINIKLECHAVCFDVPCSKHFFCQHNIIQSQCMQSVHAINSSSSTAVPAFVFVFHAHNIIFNTQIVFSFFIIIVPFRTKHKFEPIIRTIKQHNLIECKVNKFLPIKQIC